MANIVYYEDIQLVDNVKLIAGTSSDIQIYSDNSNSILDFFNLSNVLFRQHFLDGDMTFQCDDGSGGVTTYFKLDGSTVSNWMQEYILFKFQDNSKMLFWNWMQILHSMHQVMLVILEQTTNDKDGTFKSDNGSGGVTTYFQCR